MRISDWSSDLCSSDLPSMTQIPERILVQSHLAAKQPKPLTPEQEARLRSEIAAELKRQNAVLVAHYYTDPVIQALAEETGGCVSDSLEMARFGDRKSTRLNSSH